MSLYAPKLDAAVLDRYLKLDQVCVPCTRALAAARWLPLASCVLTACPPSLLAMQKGAIQVRDPFRGRRRVAAAACALFRETLAVTGTRRLGTLTPPRV
jgi:hypothetical protein